MSDRDRDAILSALIGIRAELEAGKARSDQLYAERLELYQAGQALRPPLTQREMAEATGVSEVNVTAQLRKGRQAAS